MNFEYNTKEFKPNPPSGKATAGRNLPVPRFKAHQVLCQGHHSEP